ncbi:Ras- protein Rab-22A [Tritrichomonas musculus]|uniref:Ras- protein Rab-22A n=1 Tax=Tritrichomonas musculus TaxID=1915356 RepID=A0ABR2I8S2_9EUKA
MKLNLNRNSICRNCIMSKSFKVVVIGTSNVGKTSILYRINNQGFQDNLAVTTNTSVMTRDCVLDEYNFTINYWDTAGQEKFKALAEHYYQGAKYAIAVFKINDKASFNEMLNYLITFRQKCDLISGPGESPRPNVIVAANMTDLVQDSAELIAEYQNKLFLKYDDENYVDYGVSCMLPTSAKENIGINDLHSEIQHLIIHDYLIPTDTTNNQNEDSGPGIVISEPIQPEESKSCC